MEPQDLSSIDKLGNQGSTGGLSFEELIHQMFLAAEKSVNLRNADNLADEKAIFKETELARPISKSLGATLPVYICRKTLLEVKYDDYGFPRIVVTQHPVYIPPAPASVDVDGQNPATVIQPGVKYTSGGQPYYEYFSADNKQIRTRYATPFGFQDTGWLPNPNYKPIAS